MMFICLSSSLGDNAVNVAAFCALQMDCVQTLLGLEVKKNSPGNAYVRDV